MVHNPRDRPAPRRGLTIGLWLVSLTTLGIAGVLASAFVMMAFGLDPSEIVTAGAEPWTNALLAATLFAVLVILSSLSLWLWHRTRWRMVALVVTMIEAVSVVWASVVVYRDYF